MFLLNFITICPLGFIWQYVSVVHIMAWAPSHFQNQSCLSLLIHICLTRPHWIIGPFAEFIVSIRYHLRYWYYSISKSYQYFYLHFSGANTAVHARCIQFYPSPLHNSWAVVWWHLAPEQRSSGSHLSAIGLLTLAEWGQLTIILRIMLNVYKTRGLSAKSGYF